MNKYKVVIDFLEGHKIINKSTGNEFFITGAELEGYFNYSQLMIRECISFSKALHHIDNYLHNLII